mgnify:CR=1 FL=1
MANYSENKIVFFSENKKAVHDLWQKISDYMKKTKQIRYAASWNG